ncbi:MAG TPA: sulfatase [Rubrobacter sp.]
MRRIVVVLASMLLAVGLLFSGSYAGISADLRKAVARTAPARPNIVFILTDDMRKDDLAYMPKTRSLLEDKGMSFENAFVSNALCAPSRATILRGQYSHNTQIFGNSLPKGGWEKFRDRGLQHSTVATRLHDAGYRTGLFGKYMNSYANTTYRPPGWGRWFAASEYGDPNYFDYDVNDQGTIRHYDTSDSDYITDVLSRQTNAFIRNNASGGKPFFAYVAPVAPHAPATPAPRDVHTYDGVNGPRLSSFDETNVSDKPSWIRQLPRLTPDKIAAIDNRHERRVESLQAVDDLVQGVVRTLSDAGAMRNTYIFFTSDNGFHHGEHRIPREKWLPYEEDVHMPLLVRGPGVAAGSATYNMVLNTDYLPTFTDLAGTRTPSYVDGRTLEPVLHGTVTTWRSAVLLEAAAHRAPAYRGIRTVNTDSISKLKYVEYRKGARELYDLDPDPHERTNHYDDAPSPVVDALAAHLQALKGCAGDTCFTAENRP